MANDQAELLIHPVRMRIILALANNREMTTQQLGDVLEDIPPATLYRHLQRLLAGGVLEVAQERQVRGAMEKTYMLREGAANVSVTDLASMSRDDLMRFFTTLIGGLLGDFGRYLRREDLNPGPDGLSFRQVPLYLSDAERDQFVAKMFEAIGPFEANRPAPGRHRYIQTTIRLPLDDGATSPEHTRSEQERQQNESIEDDDATTR